MLRNRPVSSSSSLMLARFNSSSSSGSASTVAEEDPSSASSVSSEATSNASEVSESVNESADAGPLDAAEQAIAVEEEMAHIRRLFKSRQVSETESKVDMSPEMQKKLDDEFNNFLREFLVENDFLEEFLSVVNVDDTKSSDVKSILSIKAQGSEKSIDESGNIKGQVQFPNVVHSEIDEPYTSQELYLRRLFHASSVSGLGSTISNVYKPHQDIFSPPSIRQTSINTLLAAGAHLGHSTSMLRQNNQQFVYGIRDGIHIIDLEQTLTYLRRAANVVQGVSEKGGVILYVGTLEGQEKSLQVAANRSNGYYVHSRWIPGTLTNSSQVSGSWARHEVDMADAPTGRKLAPNLHKTIVKPDLVVILNPVENRNLIHECLATRIPTIGIIDTNSEPSLVTYPIPANDDSLRTSDLIVGILSKSAQRGRNKRLAEYTQYQREATESEQTNAFNTHEHTSSTTADSIVPEEDLANLAAQETRSRRRAPKSGLSA
ncbi:mitochondrial 37S ribosomal protein MRP4 [Sugiyamaella lignohabitans]|uniref:Mitochondrial 37S ribosomal protein MRP4 n=1 Tax=Sugiyamaella lignohabitans TaxID=796027 RepID=A0A167DPU6_9ASCO|nr:mitochondrial 37S ribosomal protein MRP4 [Sugiyamaella lignohabitans]ANB13149.1 mitochondrial 37S ribosomal protein MRP4 [Sugiyamaella lignohabitans]